MQVEIPISQEVLDNLGINLEEFRENPGSFRETFSEWLKTDEGKEYARQHKRRLDEKNSSN